MIYPDEVPCGRIQPRSGSRPCDGKATRCLIDPVVTTPAKGPWYGCAKCGRMAQYYDFRQIENAIQTWD